jgi:serine/threonine protein kinase
MLASEGLRFEAALLTSLPSHENIIKIHAVSTNFWNNQDDGFIILERLCETLDKRLLQWKKHTSRFAFLGSQSHAEHLRQEHQRIDQIGLKVAKAMQFLHRHQVLHRDLKPSVSSTKPASVGDIPSSKLTHFRILTALQNVGFDFENEVRLFDFGFSRTITEEPNKDCKLTMCIGTPRYMAPECEYYLEMSTSSVQHMLFLIFVALSYSVALGTNYYFSVDVYSFAMLLWEICTLQQPFPKTRSLEHWKKLVVLQGHRPSLRRIASPEIKELLKAGWDPNPAARPTFAPIVRLLETLNSET